MCDDENKKDSNDEKSEGDVDMVNITEDATINVSESISKSLDEVAKIERGELPEKSYKNMIERVRNRLNEEKP